MLRTNDSALRFYRRSGARSVDELEVMRVEGAGLAELAASGRAPVPAEG